MTALLLDTTFLIHVERGDDDLDKVIDDDDDIALAAITVAELRVGVELASARQRPLREAFVDEVVLAIPALGYDTADAVRHAELLVAVRRVGRPRGAHELIIGATAAASGRTTSAQTEPRSGACRGERHRPSLDLSRASVYSNSRAIGWSGEIGHGRPACRRAPYGPL